MSDGPNSKGCISGAIVHTSTIILTSDFRPLTSGLSVVPEKLLHDLSALFFKHAGGNFNSMIQKIRITNSKARFHRACSLILCAIDQSLHSCLDQSAGAHHAGFDRRINYSVFETIVSNLFGRRSQRNYLGMRRWIVIRACSVAGDGENCIAHDDAGADRNFAPLLRVTRC